MRWCVELTSFADRGYLRLGSRLKAKLVALGLLFGVVALITSGASWLEVSIGDLTGQEQSKLFSGFETFGYLLPMLLVYHAGLFLVSISGRSLRLFGAVLAFISASCLFILCWQDILNIKISGVMSILEKASGVSGPALVERLDVSFLNMAYVSLVFYALMAFTGLVLAGAGKRVDGQAQGKRTRVGLTKNAGKDPISLWDNQS